ncbi:hypothetical protein CXB51_022758 [Gossypium anomalum]|uniref:Uncharacterized protein n=4 Tax=Gossypium TaxID=3633 RepID=A0A8J5YL26_9ROSI|nr:hypothetical protein CXB51_022758 [Gossypium anomalum]
MICPKKTLPNLILAFRIAAWTGLRRLTVLPDHSPFFVSYPICRLLLHIFLFRHLNSPSPFFLTSQFLQYPFKSLEIRTPKQLINCQIAASSFFPTSIPLLFTMMMSMFSSFEALLFDSHGQKKYTATSTPIEKAKPNEVSCSEGNKKETTEFNNLSKSSSSSVVKTPQKQRLRPRFAPELDGVHCFETIIPY